MTGRAAPNFSFGASGRKVGGIIKLEVRAKTATGPSADTRSAPVPFRDHTSPRMLPESSVLPGRIVYFAGCGEIVPGPGMSDKVTICSAVPVLTTVRPET
jgi:hypothetical protein